MLYVRIHNGGFIVYDEKSIHAKPLVNENVTVENLKMEILNHLKTVVFPVKVRNVIYDSLAKLSRLEVKKPCKLTNEQEKSDPLYQHLYNWVITLPEYQEVIKTSRRAETIKEGFNIYDINGFIKFVPNDDLNLEILRKKHDFTIPCDKIRQKKYKAKTAISKIMASELDVNVCQVNYSNPFIADFYNLICDLNKKKEVIIKDGDIWLRIDKEYYRPEPHVTVDNLKLEIINYIKSNPSQVHKTKIILGGLEALTGLRAVKAYPRYETIYVGKDNLRRDVLIEDPLIHFLEKYLDELPEYQEVKKQRLAYTSQRLEERKAAQILIKEQKYVDQNCAFYGTYLQKRRKVQY